MNYYSSQSNKVSDLFLLDSHIF